MSKCEHLDAALICAAGHGHLNRLKLVLEAGADVNATDEYESTALIASLFNNHFNCAFHLIEAGADVNMRNECGTTAIMLAATAGHLECVRCLIQAGADVNSFANEGATALFNAAFNGYSEVLRELLEAGADVNNKGFVRNWNDPFPMFTPLLVAAQRGHLECVQLLLKSGADVNARALFMNYTALIGASYRGHFEIVRELLRAGADPSMRDKDGNSALTATLQIQASAYRSQPAFCARILLQSGLDLGVSSADKNSESALYYAILCHDTECLKMLTGVIADLNAVDSFYGTTSLMHAGKCGRQEAMEILLEAGADTRERDKSGMTLLLHLAAHGKIRGVKLLANAVRMSEGDASLAELVNTPLVRPDRTVVRRMPLEDLSDINMDGFTPLMVAALRKKSEIIKELLRLGAHVGLKSDCGQNSLEIYIAASGSQENQSVAMLLLAAGERVQTSSVKVFDWTDNITGTVAVPEYLRTDDSLKSLCRTAIRRHLMELSPLNLFHRIPHLLEQLPSLPVKYLLYHVALDDEEEQERGGH